LTSKLLGRDRHVQLTLERIDPNRSFSYEPRRGLRGLVDRTVLRSAVRRLLARTVDALEVALISSR